MEKLSFTKRWENTSFNHLSITMEKALKIVSWVSIVFAVLAIIGLATEDGNQTAGMLVGLLMAAQGTMSLIYIDNKK